VPGAYVLDVDLDALRAAGLYDPDAPNADDRLALLEWIADHGISVDEMIDAKKHGSLTGLVGDGVVRPGTRVALREAARRCGLTPDELQRVWQATGFAPVAPDTPSFTDADIETFEIFRGAAEMFGWPQALHFTRVLGSSLARIAEAAVSLFQVNVEARLAEEAAGELALAKANLEATEVLGALSTLLDTLFRQHMEAAIERSRISRVVGEPFGTARFAVGFVDLVGFTPLSLRMESPELASLVEDFEARAADLVVERGGRVVKLIGDEVMFIALDPVAACEIALGLVDEFRASERVTPRGGIAHGMVITRSGDYYGPVVNLAARIADLAVPLEILASGEIAATGATGFCFEPAGRRMLKGFADPVALFAVSRA
jgi:adenylate cyclase